MKNSGFSYVMLAILSASLLFAVPRPAQADWFWRHPASHHRYDHRDAATIIVLPREATPIVVGDSTYYYCRGIYYKHSPRGYVVVPAPLGAVVPVLPEQHQTIVIDGITYHSYDGVYYKGGPAGYTVVPIYQNGATLATTTTSLPGQPTGQTSEKTAVVVNIPNKNGSYTPVTLQLASNGMYIGPQGEVYPNRPDLGQLQAMYGK